MYTSETKSFDVKLFFFPPLCKVWLTMMRKLFPTFCYQVLAMLPFSFLGNVAPIELN